MNKAAQKSIQANPMTLLNDQQKRVFHLAEKLRQTKSLRHSQSLSKSPPSAGERKLMHDIYLETKQYQDQKFDQPRRPSDLIWMDETTLDSMNVTFPENRNVHNKIFGGYLMRLALELAYANGHLFCKGPPHLIAIDDITFKKPVPIGSLLNLSSQVTYSLGAPNTAFEVSVTADVIRPSSGTRETTNVFHLTFKPPTSAPFPRVLPRSYTDLMKYIEAHRRYEQHKDRFTLPRELIED
ncbi:hypothetical protein H4R35_005412 [Dimargaris xerosporica]|nr:hypothetical protein H4R35_005412 [Dimargaris xerosporica]